MSETITLYVDGACRGNPGLGGWGAYVITAQAEHKLYGGELQTTNNRMELTAAIQGVEFCPMDAKLIIWTDSNYVKQGITEWIHGWKKKAWKNVKNPDLWQKLDAVCQNREIEWHWIKGHAGHAGNEMADHLANLGADQAAAAKHDLNVEIDIMTEPKTAESDWLLDDPFGFDLLNNDEVTDASDDIAATQDSAENLSHSTVLQDSSTTDSDEVTVTKQHPHVVITPATLQLQGPRQLILDTETTGFYYQDGDRIIEVGAIEMINRKLTGSSIHIYVNPEKPVGESENVHGISDQFLKDKPKFAEISDILFDYLKGAEIIAHNATFDMNFLNMEFTRSSLPALSEVCEVCDTLALAKNKHPGQKNSLDALVKRYEIPARDRTFHGALLDAEILSDVYLAMTGGQVSFDIDALSNNEQENTLDISQRVEIQLQVILPSADELEAHETWVKQYEEKHGETCIFAKLNAENQ